MICAVISGPTLKDICEQIQKVLPYADLLEWRLDLFKGVGENELKELRKVAPLPVIFTLWSGLKKECGQQALADYLDKIRFLLLLRPDYLDMESHLPLEFFDEVRIFFPEIKVICSYHDFTNTPNDLSALYQKLKQKPAFFYKIALMAESSSDALRVLNWVKNEDKKLIAISMGTCGKISRILAPVMGIPIAYAAVAEENPIVPGQCSAKALVEIYHYHSLNPNTPIYGLIGDPIDQSLSHESHNALIERLNLEGVYVKMAVKPSELPSFLKLARQLPFSGLSVTMPLKEAVIKSIDRMDFEAQAIGAVNTLLFEDGEIIGFNTDGTGALKAIERYFSVKGKKMIIIGAGGAAKAIAYEACKREAAVTLLNRNQEKVRALAQSLDCEGEGLEKMQHCFLEGCDFLINATPIPLPIDPSFLNPSIAVMDITTVPKETLLLQKARERGCRLIYGYQMFVEQAVSQFSIWFKNKIVEQSCRKIIEDKVLELITIPKLIKN